MTNGDEFSLGREFRARKFYFGGIKQMRVKILVVFSAVLLLLGATGLASSQVEAAESGKQIVTVNIQDVLLGSEAGQEVKKVLEGKVGEFQQKFQKEQEEVDALRAEIEKKSTVWSQEVKEEKERDYQKRVREMQLKSEDAQFELQQLEKQVMSPVLNELQKVIKEVGKKNGYAMIIDSRAGLLYVDEALDISEVVKKELDARQKAATETK
jgi:outer membrane protein